MGQPSPRHGGGLERGLARRSCSSEITERLRTADIEPDAPVRVSRRSAELCPSAAHVLRLRDAVIERELARLIDEHLGPACHVEARVAEGSVTLRGCVSCPLASMLAEDLAYSVSGVRECLNGLQVA